MWEFGGCWPFGRGEVLRQGRMEVKLYYDIGDATVNTATIPSYRLVGQLLLF